jgi:hypothetical protein
VLKGLRYWSQNRAFKALAEAERQIVFYSESGQDWHHFAPVIAELNRRGVQICYLASAAADPALTQNNPLIKAFCIGGGAIRTAAFQWLNAGVMVMTMIDLENLQIKRSVNPVCYAFMFHSLISTHMADHPDSYDHYDAILCAGPHQAREVRKREELHQLKEKQLFEHGYQRLEQLAEERREPPSWSADKDIHVLLAPSWGDETILNLCGLELTGVLLDAGFKVTLRPHYQTRWMTPDVIDQIVQRYGAAEQFSLVEAMGESASLFDSHIMITDWSGAGMDYGMGLEKPVLYIDVPVKARNDVWPELGMEPFESFVRDQSGAILSPQQMADAPATIHKLLENPQAFRDNVATLRDDWVYNFGSSSAAAADAIIALSEQV